MFYILSKNFNGRFHDRYFQDWNKAKEEMEKDIKDCIEDFNGKIVESHDFFNQHKGFYIYEKKAYFEKINEYCTWTIIDGYFED